MSLSGRASPRASEPKRTTACVGFCVALGYKPSFSQGKPSLFSILLGELSHFGKEWHQEAEGGKTFCPSAFLEVVGLVGFSICQSLPPPATIQYATFYAAVSKRTLTVTTVKRNSHSPRSTVTMGRLKVNQEVANRHRALSLR